MVCAAVNTCKYCHETTGQLEKSIVKLDHAYLFMYTDCENVSASERQDEE